MKYIIDIPDEKTYAYINDEKTFLRMPISLGENEIKSMFAPTMLRIKPYTEPDRKAIENEVWEFVRCVYKMNGDDYHECFGIDDVSDEDYCTKYSYQEAKAEYDAWKKQKEEIHIGDEVNFGNRKGVVVRLADDGVDIVWSDGSTVYMDKADILKTGKFFEWAEEFMEKMRGEIG